MKTTLIHNANIPGLPGGSWVIFNNDTILGTGTGNDHPAADTVIDAGGMTLLPGAIDAHVHFRQPGLTHKADIASESLAARAGGVTSIFDMPNTIPQTTSPQAVKEKMDIAAATSAVNYAFFIGATNDNINTILNADYTHIPGIKVFMGSSTGNMLVDNDTMLDRLFANAKVPIVVHAEDETIIANARKEADIRYNGNPPVSAHSEIRPAQACVAATARAIDLCRRHPSAHLHVAHVSTAAEVDMIAQAKTEGLHVTAEVSPHHLLFTTDDYTRLGARIKMNPSVKTPADRDALRKAVIDGTIDIIATDHAPHTLTEKQGNAFTAVSGAPMVQFSLPAMLDIFDAATVQRAMCTNPARIFGMERRGAILAGYVPDLVLVADDTHTVTDADVVSKCGWTPLDGTVLHHKVVRTFVNPKALTFSGR